MMDSIGLMDYAREKGILRTRKAFVIEVRSSGDTVTVIYKVDGQRYVNDQYSARSLTTEESEATKVNKETGEILTGTVYKKSNFWCWKPGAESIEA